MTSTVFAIRFGSTSPFSMSSAASETTRSELSSEPIFPRRSKQYEWKVFISTNEAAFPMRSMSRFLNSVAAALEKVTIKSCSCFTSSSSISDASLWTSTRVFPLPGPAATTMYFDDESFMISD